MSALMTFEQRKSKIVCYIQLSHQFILEFGGYLLMIILRMCALGGKTVGPMLGSQCLYLGALAASLSLYWCVNVTIRLR